MYPDTQDVTDQPYFIKICINGAFRRVKVPKHEANMLPSSYFDNESGPLRVQRYIWPSLIESALKKVYLGAKPDIDPSASGAFFDQKLTHQEKVE
jgi:hypothetical protein